MCQSSASGHPQQPLFDALQELGFKLGVMDGDQDRPVERLKAIFEKTGLTDIATRTIDVEQSFADFDEFWRAQNALENRSVQAIRSMSPDVLDRFKSVLRARLPTDTSKRIIYTARANAVKGRVQK